MPTYNNLILRCNSLRPEPCVVKFHGLMKPESLNPMAPACLACCQAAVHRHNISRSAEASSCVPTAHLQMWGPLTIRVPSWGPIDTENSALGSILRSPYFGKLSCRCWVSGRAGVFQKRLSYPPDSKLLPLPHPLPTSWKPPSGTHIYILPKTYIHELPYCPR